MLKIIKISAVLCLPLLTIASLNVTLDVDINKLKEDGGDQVLVQDNDLQLFNLTEVNLRKGCRVELGNYPNNIYIKSPTPWNLYKSYNWAQVARAVNINSSQILEGHSKNVTLITHEFTNNSTKPEYINPSLSQMIRNTVKTSWKFTHKFTHDVNIFVNLTYSNISYKSIVGVNVIRTERQKMAVLMKQVKLKPGQSVVVRLIAKKNIWRAKIDYVFSLVGNVATNFETKYGSHHFWAPQVGDVMKAIALNNKFYASEYLKVEYYSNPRIHISEYSQKKIDKNISLISEADTHLRQEK